MNEYKFADEAHTVVVRENPGEYMEAEYCGLDSPDYVEYVANGGLTDPWKTPIEMWHDEKNNDLHHSLSLLSDLTGIMKENAIHADMGLDTLPSQLASDISSYAVSVQTHVKSLVLANYPDTLPAMPHPVGGVGGGIPVVIEKFHNHLYIN